jgi:hypothetical protein
MNTRTLVFGAAAVLAASLYAGSAYAYTEVEIGAFHASCLTGDRNACARRDEAIHDRAHEGEWRVRHPEWYR